MKWQLTTIQSMWKITWHTSGAGSYMVLKAKKKISLHPTNFAHTLRMRHCVLKPVMLVSAAWRSPRKQSHIYPSAYLRELLPLRSRSARPERYLTKSFPFTLSARKMSLWDKWQRQSLLCLVSADINQIRCTASRLHNSEPTRSVNEQSDGGGEARIQNNDSHQLCVARELVCVCSLFTSRSNV